MVDFKLAPGEDRGHDVHQHTLDNAFVWLEKSRLIGYKPDEPNVKGCSVSQCFDVKVEENTVVWLPIKNGGFDKDGSVIAGKEAHGGKNGYSDSWMREYLIELK